MAWRAGRREKREGMNEERGNKNGKCNEEGGGKKNKECSQGVEREGVMREGK